MFSYPLLCQYIFFGGKNILFMHVHGFFYVIAFLFNKALLMLLGVTILFLSNKPLLGTQIS